VAIEQGVTPLERLPLGRSSSGKSLRSSAKSPALPVPRPRKSVARKIEFREASQVDLGRPVGARKIFRFPSAPDRWLHLAIPPRKEGRIAIVTNVEAGCGGRDCIAAREHHPEKACPARVAGWTSEKMMLNRSARTNDVVADGQAVWSWRPDAGVKLAMMLRITLMTVAKEPGHRGERGVSR
jgi:hypothetical protein